MRRTLIGVFDRHDAAHAAREALDAAGFGPDRVRATTAAADLSADDPAPADDGVAAHLRSFFAELFGPAHAHSVEPYAQAVRAGGALVKIDVDDESALDRARSILQRCGAASVDDRPRGASEP